MGHRKSDLVVRIVSTLCLLALAVIWVFPLLWAFGASFKSDTLLDTGSIFPSAGNWTWENYKYLLTSEEYPVLRWTLNSFILSSISTIIYLIIVAFAAYALVFVNWKFKNLVFNLILASMMVPGIVNFVPLFNLMDNFGIATSTNWTYYIALFLPGLGGVFGLFLIRSFFLNVPKELIESCKIDGCNNIQIFFKIVLPIEKGAFFTAAIFAFLGTWNDFMWPQQMALGVDLYAPELLTLPVGLSKLVGSKTGSAIPLAAAVLSAIPVMLVYCFTQKYIIESVSRSGIK